MRLRLEADVAQLPGCFDVESGVSAGGQWVAWPTRNPASASFRSINDRATSSASTGAEATVWPATSPDTRRPSSSEGSYQLAPATSWRVSLNCKTWIIPQRSNPAQVCLPQKCCAALFLSSFMFQLFVWRLTSKGPTSLLAVVSKFR